MSRTNIPTYDFSIGRGRDRTVNFRYRADGAPVNLGGMVLEFVCTNAALNQNAVIEFPRSGEFTLAFPASMTTSLASRNLKYQIIIHPEGIGGPNRILMSGKVELVQGLV
mgnify:CR=1 FL=1